MPVVMSLFIAKRLYRMIDEAARRVVAKINVNGNKLTTKSLPNPSPMTTTSDNGLPSASQ